ncbi:MAG: zinc-binding dehydrogenase [Hyphomonadaceae bacterium]|nr:zinc-binding dehydrogenase [Hyphomonadaceae bacterium]
MPDSYGQTETDKVFQVMAPRRGPAKSLRGRTVELPPPGQGEVRVDIEFTGVAYADIVMRNGLYAGVKLPVVPGYDLVGRVAALGPGVDGLQVGDRVAGITVTGSYATAANVQADWLVRVPEETDGALLLAGVLNGVTAWQMLTRVASADPGEWIVVCGAGGGVGSILLDLARARGVRAIGLASPGKHDAIRAAGAEPLDYRERAGLADRIKEITAGGAVAVFDHIAGSHLRKVSLPALQPGGTAVVFGAYDTTRGGRIRVSAILGLLLGSKIDSFRLTRQSNGVVGYNVTLWRNNRPGAYREDLADVMEAISSGSIRPAIGATLPLADAARAHAMLEAREVTGKIVLDCRSA